MRTVSDYKFSYDSTHPPVVIVGSGTRVAFQTLDARCGRMKGPEDVETSAPDLSAAFPSVDPATGPVGVVGAAPGDTLKVTVEEVRLADQGFVIVKPDMGIARDLVDAPVGRMLSIVGDMIQFSREVAGPVRPMVGIVSTAPSGPPVASVHMHHCGGNMDNNRIRPGATVYLPVDIPLGLLYIGDVHATMGDGEVCGLGAEVSATVVVTVELLKERLCSYPIVEDSKVLATTGIGSTFYEAADLALSQMISQLSGALHVSESEAYMLASCWGDLRVNQACNSAPLLLGVRMEFPRAEFRLAEWGV